MLLQKTTIERQSVVNTIVKENHHTAVVFRKYGIEYCCGGKWPLETVCMMKGLEFHQLKKELELASRIVQLPPALDFEKWSIDFLTSYIVNIHHQFLKDTLPETGSILAHFAEEHNKKYPYLPEVVILFEQLNKELLPHIQYEEDTIFPYIRQVGHAYENNDSYASLLVKTLRKPLDSIMLHEEDVLSAIVLKIRIATNNYSIPPNACVSHIVTLSRLRELDNDLMQHIYLENEVLFPRTLKIEQELLK